MRIQLYLIILMLGCLIGAACAQHQPSKTYKNPVLKRDFPDPAVFKAGDGWIYTYATQGRDEGLTVNIQMARSHDLVHWEYLGDAMPKRPEWANETQNFWAPDLLYDHQKDTYFLYFSSDRNNKDGHCIGVATSQSLSGPFKDAGAPIVCGEGFVNIDPMAFDDPQTEKKLLYWGSGFEPLKVRELSDSRTFFKEGSKTKPIVFPGKESEYTHLLEGSWVTYHDGKYYIYYSGDNCCGEQANYAVMVARADSAEGPFDRMAEAGAENSVILHKSPSWLAPGHNAVIEDDNGQEWMLYHAINTKPDNGTVNYYRRVLLIDPIYYKEGWPYIEGKEPSDEQMLMPYFK